MRDIVRFLNRWHRRLGITASLWLLLLSITGLALQYPDATGLRAWTLSQEWVLELYGYEVPETIPGYRSDDSFFCVYEGQLLRSGNILLPADELLAVAKGDQKEYLQIDGQWLALGRDGSIQELANIPARQNLIEASTASNDEKKAVIEAIYGKELNAYRLLSDLHSGALFGISGKTLNTFSALVLIYLAISGLFIYLRRLAAS